MLLNMKELLKVADENHFAIPAFNIASYAMFNGIIDISEKKNSPVIIEIHPDELKHIGSDMIAGFIKRASETSIPVVIHLDHGASFENIMVAIRAGFTSVMIDASALPFDENVANCKKVVEAAHAAKTIIKKVDPYDPRKVNKDMSNWKYTPSEYAQNVSVEGELGNIGSTDVSKVYTQEIHYTQPEEAVKFIQETGIDTLAVAIGTSHGLYPKGFKPDLKLELLRQIKQAIVDAGLDTQLVLHGGSGNPNDELEQATKLGICKINISSDIKVAYYNKMREVLEDKTLREPIFIEQPCIEAMQEVAAHYIDLFGAAEKASLY